MADNILRLPTVIQRSGRSRTQIYAAIQRGEFPSQVQLGPRAVGWLESSIDAWIAARPKKADTQAREVYSFHVDKTYPIEHVSKALHLGIAKVRKLFKLLEVDGRECVAGREIINHGLADMGLPHV